MVDSLVTGGAGFIGSHVAECLLRSGRGVLVLDDLSGGFIENVPAGAAFVEGSILDVELLEHLFRKHRFNHVYHMAAYAAEGLSHFIKRFNHTNNLIGSVNLINAAVNHSVKCFVFTSSIAVYGEGRVPMSEATAPKPEDSYGIAKLAVESELRVSREMFGLDYVIFRPHNVYGERQNIADRYRNVVGIFMNQLLRGEPMTIFGDGSQKRAFTHINDIAPIIARAVAIPRARNQVFNIGADRPFTVKALSELVAKAMKLPHRVKHLPPRKEVSIALPDHEKAQRVLGYCPSTRLSDGLEAMAAWVKTHGARQSSLFTDIEIMRNMPPSWCAAMTGMETATLARDLLISPSR